MKKLVDCACSRMELCELLRTDVVFLRMFKEVVEEITEIKKRPKIFSADLHLASIR